MVHSLNLVYCVFDLSVLFRDYWVCRTRCDAVGSGFEGVDGFSFNRAAWEGGGMLVPAVGTLERDGVAAIRYWFVVSSFHAPLIPTSVCVSGVAARADGAGGEERAEEAVGETTTPPHLPLLLLPGPDPRLG